LRLELTHGFVGARPGYPFPLHILEAITSVEEVDSFEGYPDKWLSSSQDVFQQPDLPLFRVMAANLKGGPDSQGRASIIQVRSAHCLLEGSDAALLTRSQTANHGIQSDKGATAVRVRTGERVWWDFHDWGASDDIPAVVGQYPEPFLHGIGGRKLPTRVECVDVKDPACDEVQGDLVDFGLPASKGQVGSSFVQDTLRILVGPWVAVREDNTAGLIAKGPGTSGVYVKPSADGRFFALLDQRGRVTRTLGPGTGLIAATAAKDDRGDPVWVVTGTDEAGVQAAAGALDEGALNGKFAVVISGGKPIGVPEAR